MKKTNEMREFLHTWGPRAGYFLAANVVLSVLIYVLIERGIAKHALAQEQCRKTCSSGTCLEDPDSGRYVCNQ